MNGIRSIFAISEFLPSILRGVSDIELNRFLLRLMSLFIYLSFYFVFIFRDVLSTSLFYEVPFVVLI